MGSPPIFLCGAQVIGLLPIGPGLPLKFGIAVCVLWLGWVLLMPLLGYAVAPLEMSAAAPRAPIAAKVSTIERVMGISCVFC